jgi:hypothetical protein
MLDARHPVKRRADRITSPTYGYDTRLKRHARRAVPTELVDPRAIPPWEKTESGDPRIGYRPGLAKEQAASDFRAWAAARQARDVVIYTDGSQLASPTRAAGAGWVAYQAGR